MLPMNDKEKELQFLQIIRVNGNIYHLIMSEWTYRDIIVTLNRFSKAGLVTVHEGGTVLTQKGNLYFKNLYKVLGKKGVARFLSTATDRKFSPLSKESIYIPTTFRASEEF